MWSGNFKTAFSYLRLYKWRSLLTMMGIIIGVSSVVTIISLGQGLKNQVVGQIDQLGSDVLTIRSGKLVHSHGPGLSNLNLLVLLNTSTLTYKDVRTLQNLPTISEVAPLDFLTNSATAGNNRVDNISVMGTTPDFLDLMRQNVQYGNFLDKSPQDQNTVVIGHTIARQLFHETNVVGETINISGQSFIVRGVLTQSNGGLLSVGQVDFNSTILMPFQMARGLAGGQTNILQILVRAKHDSSQLDSTIGQINTALLANHNGQEDFSVLRQKELLGLLSSVINTITGFISAIAAISLLVGGIGIMDIMLVSISERTREIGVRKAIGATNGQILNQFLVEGLTLTIVGGLIGVGLALLVNAILRVYTTLHPAINIPIIILAVGVSVAVGLIFSTIPALKAARKDPIIALRG